MEVPFIRRNPEEIVILFFFFLGPKQFSNAEGKGGVLLYKTYSRQM